MLTPRIVSAIALLSLAFGCQFKGNNNSDYAYIGGEIINPKNKSIVLYNTKGKIVDSITLDVNNRFIHKIDNLQPGLYSITHGGEYQMLLLEPNDSIMFRLNTYDFDESLVFTGDGAKKNNYLIKTYLANHKEAKKLSKYAQKEPEDFNKFIETRRHKRLNEFHSFLVDNETLNTPFFKSIIEANINYNAYADKEIYPFAYFGNNKLIHIKDLPEDFYAFRDSIDYNANYLSNFFSYNRFLFAHFDNLALKSFYKNHAYHSTFNRHSIAYNKSKLDLIDSLITDETIKNNLFKYKARDFISHNHSNAETQEMLDYYLAKSTSDEDKVYMTDLVASLMQLSHGNALPDLTVISYDNKEHSLPTIITKPTIIYFWTSNRKAQYRNSHYKVNQLKAKFPQMDFVSVNIKDNDDEFWKNIINQYNFPTASEYKFKDSKKALKTLALNYLNKAIIVDDHGHILHSNANIYSSEFENTLEELLKQKKHSIQ